MKQRYYYCPNDCGDKRFSRPRWKTEKGFNKHLESCPNSPERLERARLEKLELERVRLERERKLIAACAWQQGDKAFAVCETIIKPEHEQRGTRLVRVRYESVKAFHAECITVEAIRLESHQGGLSIYGGYRRFLVSDLFATLAEAETEAINRQLHWDKHCEYSEACR